MILFSLHQYCNQIMYIFVWLRQRFDKNEETFHFSPQSQEDLSFLWNWIGIEKGAGFSIALSIQQQTRRFLSQSKPVNHPIQSKIPVFEFSKRKSFINQHRITTIRFVFQTRIVVKASAIGSSESDRFKTAAMEMIFEWMWAKGWVDFKMIE